MPSPAVGKTQETRNPSQSSSDEEAGAPAAPRRTAVDALQQARMPPAGSEQTEYAAVVAHSRGVVGQIGLHAVKTLELQNAGKEIIKPFQFHVVVKVSNFANDLTPQKWRFFVTPNSQTCMGHRFPDAPDQTGPPQIGGGN